MGDEDSYRGRPMTDIYENWPLFICQGCESEMENIEGRCDKFDEFESCPLCMTLDELWELRFGSQAAKGEASE